MSKVIFIVLSLIVVALNSCRSIKTVNDQKAETTGPAAELLKDRDGNTYPVKKMLDGNYWKTANLKLDIANSYSYDSLADAERYGRLYTW